MAGSLLRLLIVVFVVGASACGDDDVAGTTTSRPPTTTTAETTTTTVATTTSSSTTTTTTTTTVPPEPVEITVDVWDYDEELTAWDDYVGYWEDIAGSDTTHTHAYGAVTGSFVYRVDFPLPPQSEVAITARLSSELYGEDSDAYDDRYSDVTLRINDVELESQRVVSDDDSGEMYTWTVDAEAFVPGENLVAFVVPADAEYATGLCIYQVPGDPEAYEEVPITITYLG